MNLTSYRIYRTRIYRTICLGLMACLILFPGVAAAHYASITLDNYSPRPGETVTVTIGFGHVFPGDGAMRRAAYAHTRLVMVSPKGERSTVDIEPLAEKGNKPIEIRFDEPGVHTLALVLKHFSTKTTKGYKYQPKNELTSVLHSKWSETVSKALVSVQGKGRDVMPSATEDRFQITALKEPGPLPRDGYLPVKVTLDGKPWRGMVFATYAGFSDRSDAFAYAVRTDKEGVAEIKLLQKGLWLVKADHTYPYEAKEKADDYALKATLTFDY